MGIQPMYMDAAGRVAVMAVPVLCLPKKLPLCP